MSEKCKEGLYTVHGRKMHFSKKEIEAYLEKCIPKESLLPKTFEVAEKPTDGKAFKVNLEEINLALLLEERNVEQQEWTRKVMLEAFIEALKEPETYRVFYILIPKKKWVYGDKEYTTVEEQMEFAKNVGEGSFISNWITEALGWAQRISNGETWKAVCNNPDTIKWIRLFIWKNGEARVVGGASEKHGNNPASDVSFYNYNSYSRLNCVVPSVVLKSLHCSLSSNF